MILDGVSLLKLISQKMKSLVERDILQCINVCSKNLDVIAGCQPAETTLAEQITTVNTSD